MVGDVLVGQRAGIELEVAGPGGDDRHIVTLVPPNSDIHSVRLLNTEWPGRAGPIQLYFLLEGSGWGRPLPYRKSLGILRAILVVAAMGTIGQRL